MLAAAVLALALLQTPAVVKNPAVVEFVCPDHDQDSQHELKIIQITGTNRVTITTILLGDMPYLDAATKTVRASLNVQPIAFGDYIATLSAGTATFKSEDSADSNPFQRVPGSPSKVVIK